MKTLPVIDYHFFSNFDLPAGWLFNRAIPNVLIYLMIPSHLLRHHEPRFVEL